MKPFQKKSKDKEIELKKTEQIEEPGIVDPDYNRKKLFKKGVNLMADEKLEEAAVIFEQALRVDPNNIEEIDSDGEDHVGDEAALLFMYRPLTQLPAKEEVHRPPKDISEIANLELEAIWEDVRIAEEAYNNLFEL